MNSSELKGYLTGLIFGDATIDNGITKRALRIKSINKDFIDKIENDLNSCTNFDISVRHFDAEFKNGCNHNEYWELYIKAHPYFAKKYHHFYTDERKRRASKESLNWLNEVGLANWYMSDGYVCLVGKNRGNIYNRRIEIATDRYDINTIESMQKMLKEKFNISTSIVHRGKTSRIRVLTESYENFINIVYKHLTDSFKYKAYLGYNYQPKWMSDELWNLQKNLHSAIALTSKVEG